MTYSRFRDTSLVPRFPLNVGHKPTSREHLHTMMSRYPELTRAHIKDIVALRKALRGSGEDSEDTIDNYIDSGRLKDINKQDKHHQRQLSRNRRDQIKKKIIENIIETVHASVHPWDTSVTDKNVIANATRVNRVIFRKPKPGDDKENASRRHTVNAPDSFSIWKTSKRADVDSN